MKYHRSRYAKSTTIASLALALTACILATPQASTSITQAASEEAIAGTTQSPAALVDQILPSPAPVPADAVIAVDPPVLVAEEALTLAAVAPPIATAPPTAAAPLAATPAPQESPQPAGPPATGGPAAGECTPANIDIQRHDTVWAIMPIPAAEQQYYTVLGCAEGWLAYSISDEGIRVAGLDGGNAWYSLARLQNDGRYLTDFAQLWATVHNWEFLAFYVRDGRYATVQEAMDDQFATYGIPVRLREQLVGPGPAAPAPGGPAAGECTPANIDIQRHDTVRAIMPIPAAEQQYYTVLGCAEGWLAYSISDEGIRVAGLDGGNAWYSLARLQNDGRYLTDFAQLWATVHNWEFLVFYVRDGRYATVQEAMDDQFATYGIPVRLREQLVGPGPAAGTP